MIIFELLQYTKRKEQRLLINTKENSNKMANVTVVEKSGEIDGRTVKWKRLVIQGWLSGELRELEIAINKEQALLADMILNSEEEK